MRDDRRTTEHERLMVLMLLRTALVRKLDPAAVLRHHDAARPAGRKAFADAVRELEEGGGPAAALGARALSFPEPVPALLEAIENGADPRRCLDGAIALLRQRARVRWRVRAALTYPALCAVLLAGLVMLFLGLDPLWRLGTAYSTGGSELAVWSVLADGSAERVVDQTVRTTVRATLAHPATRVAGGALLVGAIAIWLAPWIAPRGNVGAARRRLNLPVTGRFERWAAAAGFTRALAELLDAGVPIDRALDSARAAAGNAWVAARLRAQRSRVADGVSPAAAIALPGVFPESLSRRIEVGLRAGTLPDALRAASEAYVAELEHFGDRLVRLVEPVAVVAVGILAMAAVWAWGVPLNDLFGRLL